MRGILHIAVAALLLVAAATSWFGAGLALAWVGVGCWMVWRTPSRGWWADCAFVVDWPLHLWLER